MLKLRILLSLLLLSATLLSACGQKGPLFIPADETADTTTAPEMSSSLNKVEKKKAAITTE